MLIMYPTTFLSVIMYILVMCGIIFIACDNEACT